MSQCCEPGADESTPAGRRAGLIAIVVVMLVGWGNLAAVCCTADS